jgi:hypothetical protein
MLTNPRPAGPTTDTELPLRQEPRRSARRRPDRGWFGTLSGSDHARALRFMSAIAMRSKSSVGSAKAQWALSSLSRASNQDPETIWQSLLSRDRPLELVPAAALGSCPEPSGKAWAQIRLMPCPHSGLTDHSGNDVSVSFRIVSSLDKGGFLGIGCDREPRWTRGVCPIPEADRILPSYHP